MTRYDVTTEAFEDALSCHNYMVTFVSWAMILAGIILIGLPEKGIVLFSIIATLHLLWLLIGGKRK